MVERNDGLWILFEKTGGENIKRVRGCKKIRIRARTFKVEGWCGGPTRKERVKS